MHKANNLLEQDVREELDWDPVLDDGRIIVKANDGQITLTGAVPNFDESQRAVDDALKVGGVTKVDNQLTAGVSGEAIADEDVAIACQAALNNAKLVPHGSVTASARDGWVTLTGEVRRYFERRAAVHAVRRVDGVTGVTDDIVLTSQPIPSDVAERINRAFKRNAIIDDSTIRVTTADHTVYLDGTVSSWYAMDEAVDTAWQAPGVRDVVNRLVIIP